VLCVVLIVPFVYFLEETFVMKLKTSLSLLALASCAAISTSALAQSTGTLDIKGFISPVSCTPNLSGGAISGNTLSLPDAFIDDLNTNTYAGETPFSFDWSGCTTSLGVNNAWVHFSGATIDGNGRIQPTSGSQNIRFELLNGSGGSPIVAGGPVPGGLMAPSAAQGTSAAFNPPAPATTNRSASKTYAVRYYRQNMLTAADIGAVISSVTYNAVYH